MATQSVCAEVEAAHAAQSPPAEVAANAAEEPLDELVARRLRKEVTQKWYRRRKRMERLMAERIDELAGKRHMKKAAREAMIDLQRLSAIAGRDGRMSADAFNHATVIVVGILYHCNWAYRGRTWAAVTAEHVHDQLAAGLDYLVSKGRVPLHLSECTRAALRCYLGLPVPEGGASLFRDRNLSIGPLLWRFGMRYLRGTRPPTTLLLRKRQSAWLLSAAFRAFDEVAGTTRFCGIPMGFPEWSTVDACLYNAIMGEPPAWPADVERGDEAPEGLSDAMEFDERNSDVATDDTYEEDESDDDPLAQVADRALQTTPGAAEGLESESEPCATAAVQPAVKRPRMTPFWVRWLCAEAFIHIGGCLELPSSFYQQALAKGTEAGVLPPDANEAMLADALRAIRTEVQGWVTRPPPSIEPADTAA